MAYPLYPSLIPRFVDEGWFNEQPSEDATKLDDLEATPGVYRAADIHAPLVEPVDGEEEEEDEEEMNEHDEEDDEDLEDGDEIEEEFIDTDS